MWDYDKRSWNAITGLCSKQASQLASRKLHALKLKSNYSY